MITVLDKALLIVIGTSCAIAVLFAVAVIIGLIKADASLVIAAILGPLVTISGAVLGVYVVGRKADNGADRDQA